MEDRLQFLLKTGKLFLEQFGQEFVATILQQGLRGLRLRSEPIQDLTGLSQACHCLSFAIDLENLYRKTRDIQIISAVDSWLELAREGLGYFCNGGHSTEPLIESNIVFILYAQRRISKLDLSGSDGELHDEDAEGVPRFEPSFAPATITTEHEWIIYWLGEIASKKLPLEHAFMQLHSWCSN